MRKTSMSTMSSPGLVMTKKHVYSRAYHYALVRVGCKKAARDWGRKAVLKFEAEQAI